MEQDNILTMRINTELKEAVRQAAKKDRRTMSQWVEVLIANRLEQLGTYPKPADSS